MSKLAKRLRTKPATSKKNMPKALKHGKDYEKVALRKYMRCMRNIGHKVTVEYSGLVVDQKIPYIGCSPDGKVCDPVSHPHFGIVEIKCPHTYRSITPGDAATLDDTFCLELVPVLRLRRDHAYHYQIQGQMAITGARWCDFVVYTFKGLYIERVAFDKALCDSMLGGLQKFFFHKYLPEVLPSNSP